MQATVTGMPIFDKLITRPKVAKEGKSYSRLLQYKKLITKPKVAKEGKSYSRLIAVEKVDKKAKRCSKVAEHNIFRPNLIP